MRRFFIYKALFMLVSLLGTIVFFKIGCSLCIRFATHESNVAKIASFIGGAIFIIAGISYLLMFFILLNAKEDEEEEED